MMKKLQLSIIGILTLAFSYSQAQDKESDTAWKIKGDVSLMFSQSSFTNWASGGDNSLTVNGYFNFYAGYIKGKSKWENMLALAYGQTKTGGLGVRKNEDKIDFSSIYGFKAADKWFYSANFNFKTQFAEGYNYHDGDPALGKEKISNFMAPGYTSIGLGIEYRPHDYLSFYLSPVTARWIFVNDQELADKGAFGVEPAKYSLYDSLGKPVFSSKYQDGKMVKQEFGAYFRFLFVKEIVKNVNFSTKLELYSDYLDNPQNVDVNWDNTLDLKVNSWITAKVGVQVVYDDNTPITDKNGNIGPRTQVKELLSIGLSYNFSNNTK